LETRSREIDELDFQLLNLLLKGYDNKQIANAIDNPLSTIQRRTRLIYSRGLARPKIEPNYAKLGFKKGFLAVRLKGGRISKLVEMLQKIDGIISISANIGSFQIICTIIFHDTIDLWNMISDIQGLENVKDTLWSEEIYNFDKNYNISKSSLAIEKD